MISVRVQIYYSNHCSNVSCKRKNMSQRRNKKFSKFLLQKYEQLHSLSSKSLENQNDILSTADAKLISALVEICTNFLIGNIYCSEPRRQKLKPHRSALKKICRIRKLSKKLRKEREILLEANNSTTGESLLNLLLPCALATISLNLADAT